MKQNRNPLMKFLQKTRDVNFFLNLPKGTLISFVKFYFCNHEDSGTNTNVCFYNFSCYANCC